MITSKAEYNELLYAITNPNNNSSYHFRIPYDEPIYKIDLNTREVEAPKFLSVEKEHNAEVLWFQVDRFYDDYDLFGATCWIQQRNALGEEFITLSVPQVINKSNHDVLYIPWPISSAVTAKAGLVQFSFQFFKLSEDKQRLFYSINTKTASGKIESTLNIDPLKDFDNPEIEEDNFIPERSQLAQMLAELTEAYSTLSKDYALYWSEVK